MKRCVRIRTAAGLLAVIGTLCGGCSQRYIAPAPPPRTPQPTPAYKTRTYDYEHKNRSMWNVEQFRAAYKAAGSPSFAVLVNRYAVEDSPAIEGTREQFRFESERQAESSGTGANKEIHVRSDTAEVDITDTGPEEEGTAETHERVTQTLKLPRAKQPLWLQLNELEIDDAVTTALIRAGINVADADTLKSTLPPLEAPSGTPGVVPGGPVQVVVKYRLTASGFRISIKAVSTTDARLLAHVTRNLPAQDLGALDLRTAKLFTANSVRMLLHEMMQAWNTNNR